ncbi:MAG: metallophosphoesterase [Solirubrobacteraceae bacterium]
MQYIFLVFTLFLLFIEFVWYNVLKSAFPSFDWLLLTVVLFNVVFFSIIFFLVYLVVKAQESIKKWKYILRLSTLTTIVLFPKLFIIVLSSLEKIISFFTTIIFNQPPYNQENIYKIIILLGLVPIIAFLHGYFFGRYNFKVINKTVYFKNLPKQFEGFKVLQISDIHTGSLSNVKKISKGIDLINKQNADLIVFTGDLINHDIQEAEPWVEVFAKIKRAKFGNYSVLGNHDYGNKFSKILKKELEEIIKNHIIIQQKMGFKLLVNKVEVINKSNQKINLIGVENYGAPPFPQFGDLIKATEGIGNDEFNILLTHDPSHFDLEVKTFQKTIPLTLSGHTHGMQFGIEFMGFKWSPVKYKYPKWAGLYKENNKYLYVNRGFGYIGIPARIGIWPEITVLTLKKEN